MTKPSLRFMRNEHIEDVTAQRIRQYEAKVGVKVGLPVPGEEIVEQVLGLNILWDTIQEQPGEMILAGLVRRTRTIVMNEKHLTLFEEQPGLRNSTLVHEAGHADLEGGLGEQGPSLFESESEPDRIVYRHSPKVSDQIAVLYNLALRNEKAYRLLRKITQGQDTPEQKSAVSPLHELRGGGVPAESLHGPGLAQALQQPDGSLVVVEFVNVVDHDEPVTVFVCLTVKLEGAQSSFEPPGVLPNHLLHDG